ncbi:hypothetical protein Droror1_Dr00017929, partial [Drosera rotundifolia]
MSGKERRLEKARVACVENEEEGASLNIVKQVMDLVEDLFKKMMMESEKTREESDRKQEETMMSMMQRRDAFARPNSMPCKRLRRRERKRRPKRKHKKNVKEVQ